MAACILFCRACWKYTLMAECSACGAVCVPTHPARYQPGFSHHAERRKARNPQLKSRGLL